MSFFVCMLFLGSQALRWRVQTVHQMASDRARTQPGGTGEEEHVASAPLHCFKGTQNLFPLDNISQGNNGLGMGACAPPHFWQDFHCDKLVCNDMFMKTVGSSIYKESFLFLPDWCRAKLRNPIIFSIIAIYRCIPFPATSTPPCV